MASLGKSETHVIVAPTGWRGDVLQYRRHQLARYLMEKRGARIIWIYPLPAVPAGLTRKGLKIEKNVADGIVEIGIPDHRGLIQHLGVLQKGFLECLPDVLSFEDQCFLWYTYPAFGQLSRYKWKGIYYDCSDLWSEMGDRRFFKLLLYRALKRPFLMRTERNIIQMADRVFVTSIFLKQNMKKQYGVEGYIIENGVDFALFQAKANVKARCAWSGSTEPVLGFAGGMKNWKVDFVLLKRIAQERPHWKLVLIGPEYGVRSEHFSRLLEMENVYWTGLVPPEELPGYLRGLDLGILPYRENLYNRSVFPLKLFEYLACGLPVVGCGLPSTVGHEREGIYIHTGSHPGLFLRGCEQALQWDDCKNARAEVARRADWEEKFHRMLVLARGGEDG